MAPIVQGWTTACDWLEAPLLGHSPCHRFIESCPQGVLRTIRVVIQPESSGWIDPIIRSTSQYLWVEKSNDKVRRQQVMVIKIHKLKEKNVYRVFGKTALG